MKTLLATALALPFLAGPLLAQTQTGPATGLLSAADPQGLADALQGLGYKAQLATDDKGDPRIDSAADGANFSIWFYGCTNGKDCGSIQFSAGFDTPDGVDVAVLNEWNHSTRFGKAYADTTGDPHVELDVNTTGMLTPENFANTVGIWTQVLSDFQRHIGW
ncbi:hypothetical protein GCM10011452_12510 [Gemmobacter lanyuensis]|uniref:YbjN domain-containing protein n=1 Tax=Gemmobacter lanyuensis TaxID=1054497 RepID=A0A918MIS6_9RHOB|nr:YbjN domain-containing protein [Gemmobacter lanyuensis]GGW25948.1 hypothetical protein GCM10011452_12510 [Gemmobacter lanyuensis]